MRKEIDTQRLFELAEIERKLKTKRDFEALISVHEESMEILDSMDNLMNRIPQKSYCLARLGRKEEAKETLEILKTIPHELYFDRDETYRIITLVSLFIMEDIQAIDRIGLC